jgi:hypothetical protein
VQRREPPKRVREAQQRQPAPLALKRREPSHPAPGRHRYWKARTSTR